MALFGQGTFENSMKDVNISLFQLLKIATITGLTFLQLFFVLLVKLKWHTLHMYTVCLHTFLELLNASRFLGQIGNVQSRAVKWQFASGGKLRDVWRSSDWHRIGVRNMFLEQFRVSVKWGWQACATLTSCFQCHLLLLYVLNGYSTLSLLRRILV